MQFTLGKSHIHNWCHRSHCKTFFIRNIIKLTSNLLHCALSQYALIQMGAGAAVGLRKRQIKPCNTNGATEIEHFRLSHLFLMCACVAWSKKFLQGVLKNPANFHNIYYCIKRVNIRLIR